MPHVLLILYIMKNILVINGSNSVPEKSINWALASRMAKKITGYSVQLTGMHEHPLPMYQAGMENDVLPESILAFGKLVRSHDGLIIVSPEHNGLMPACLKNAIDWLSRTRGEGESFFGAPEKPVLLLSTSPGQNGGATNLKYMAELMPWWGGKVTGLLSVGGFYEKYRDGDFDEETESSLDMLLDQFQAEI